MDATVNLRYDIRAHLSAAAGVEPVDLRRRLVLAALQRRGPGDSQPAGHLHQAHIVGIATPWSGTHLSTSAAGGDRPPRRHPDGDPQSRQRQPGLGVLPPRALQLGALCQQQRRHARPAPVPADRAADQRSFGISLAKLVHWQLDYPDPEARLWGHFHGQVDHPGDARQAACRQGRPLRPRLLPVPL